MSLQSNKDYINYSDPQWTLVPKAQGHVSFNSTDPKAKQQLEDLPSCKP